MKGTPTARSILARFPADRRVGSEAAVGAVLAALRDGEDDVEVLLIERAVNEKDPASGQIGLPGGHREPTERWLDQTALREAEEEVGIGVADLVEPPRFVVVGRALSSRMRVALYAAEFRDGSPTPHALDPEEVASVRWVPRRAFSVVEPIERETSEGPRAVPAVRFADYVVWGFTLRMVRILFGYEPTPDPA